MTALLKGAGPIALGGRDLPPWFSSIVALMAPALFAALVVTQVLADGRDIGVGADTAGVALAGVAAWRGASVITVVAIAAVTAATLRAVA
jgi:branched-subunit amino acid transport protein